MQAPYDLKLETFYQEMQHIKIEHESITLSHKSLNVVCMKRVGCNTPILQSKSKRTC